MIGNTTFYGNSVIGGIAGTGGAAGTGGLGSAGTAGTNGLSAYAQGGGLAFEGGNVTMVNCTVAKNTGSGVAGTLQNYVIGSGIYDATDTALFANNTLTQNTNGDDLDVDLGNPLIVNNLLSSMVASPTAL